ncbi:MAG: hypothetical protein KF836_00665 [Fimbriimonadaceae bacterium]|nr:hypothetical protein [Fimbriimonadaceae bacterium]
MRIDSNQEKLRDLMRKSGSADAWTFAWLGAGLLGLLVLITPVMVFARIGMESIRGEPLPPYKLDICSGVLLIACVLAVVWIIVKWRVLKEINFLIESMSSERIALAICDGKTSERAVLILKKRMAATGRDLHYVLAAKNYADPLGAINEFREHETKLNELSETYRQMEAESKLDPRWRLVYLIMVLPLAAMTYAAGVPTLILNRTFMLSMMMLLLISIYGSMLFFGIILKKQRQTSTDQAKAVVKQLPNQILSHLAGFRVISRIAHSELNERGEKGDSLAKDMAKEMAKSLR